ncbi:alpha/beta-hydrolase [Periconia macrospinosa]|uniref:Alpha/beta-hydrolase n=1 Tax=Periconia macrospinosa TaxID=97972 RepID=A0A2V1DHR1_9PLEO|nr:alpha/beta-hydrolase [Periconia macrospinosa]
MSTINWPSDSVFEPFNVFEETYKTVSSHEIKAAILTPKNLQPGVHPVIVNIHGGFFATAHSLFAPFFPTLALQLALGHNAIILSADYRLLPTRNGVADQLEDLEDFWAWSREKLPTLLQERLAGHEIDYSRCLLVGGSAGGYYAAQLALSHPDEISALALIYPAVDLRDELWTEGPLEGAPTVLRFPAEDIVSKEEALKWVAEKRETISSKGGFEVTPFAVALTQHALFNEEMLEHNGVKLGTAQLPLERLKNGAKLPQHVWITHGDDDSVVYLRQSEAFVDLIRSKLPETILQFDIAKGHDHGFDLDPSCWEPYAGKAMQFVANGWLK